MAWIFVWYNSSLKNKYFYEHLLHSSKLICESLNIEIGNLTRWNQMITIAQLTRLSVRIKNPRWSKKIDNSLILTEF